ncbi:MAG: serine hydrolase [Oenococcus sp.]|uniref:serine hydrolase n=1 Tax=Oenococcus TaxID=46254 RepID=UPI0021E90BEA|nr:serine hydrolase [Oenococcus kitaharae]MCV3296555.1 LppW family protein [Oenococcus kitaharae]
MRKKYLSICCALLLSTLLLGVGVAHSFPVVAKTVKGRPINRFVMFESQARSVFDKMFFAKKNKKRNVAIVGEMLPQADFTKRVNALVGSAKADVYVLDTKTGHKLTYYNGGTNFWLASSVKASILTALVKEDGPLTGDLDQEAQAMITYSDNDAAVDLFDAAGGFPALERLWSNLGMTETIPNYNGFGLSTSTAGNQIKLLQDIKTLPAADHDYILNLMKGITASQRFGIGVMKDPAFKNGWLNADNGSWYVNSIGFSEKERYLVAILTQNNTDQTSGEQLVSRIAASIIKK